MDQRVFWVKLNFIVDGTAKKLWPNISLWFANFIYVLFKSLHNYNYNVILYFIDKFWSHFDVICVTL